MTSSAATTPKRPKIFPPQSRPPRSRPCSTRRLAWWSLRARGSTLSRRPNSALTCRIKHALGGAGRGCHQAKPAGGAEFVFLPAVLKDWDCYWFHWSQDSRDWIKELVKRTALVTWWWISTVSLTPNFHPFSRWTLFRGDGGRWGGPSCHSWMRRWCVDASLEGRQDIGSMWTISDANLDFWWGPVERAAVLDPSDLIPPWKLSWKNVFYFSVSQVCLTNATVSRPDGHLRVISENQSSSGYRLYHYSEIITSNRKQIFFLQSHTTGSEINSVSPGQHASSLFVRHSLYFSWALKFNFALVCFLNWSVCLTDAWCRQSRWQTRAASHRNWSVVRLTGLHLEAGGTGMNGACVSAWW